MSFLMRFSPLVRRAGATSTFKSTTCPSTLSALSNSTRSHPFSTVPTRQAQMDSTSQTISQTAKAEGGPTAGSNSAQMQSEVGKQQNFEQAAQEVDSKMQSNPASVTSEDANYLKSREARATGQAQPPKDSISAEAQRLATANEQGTTISNNQNSNTSSNTGPLSPEEQSQMTKQMNYEDAAAAMTDKMTNDPESVTKRDGDLMHRREQRATGHTDKGGIAAQAQKLASENEK